MSKRHKPEEIVIGLQDAAPTGKVRVRMLSPPVARGEVERRPRIGGRPRFLRSSRLRFRLR